MTGSTTRVAVGGVLLSFVLAIVIGTSNVMASAGAPALGPATSLTVIGGDVEVSRRGGPFEPATDGMVLGPGDVVRTAADSRAVLTYFEGSTVSIEPSSEVAIEEASAAADGSTIVLMTQSIGRTWHVVTKLITGRSKYEVRTPAGTAAVRGTAFEVGVTRDTSGATLTAIVTAEGVVTAAARPNLSDPEPEQIAVGAGFQTTARSMERRPETPARVPEPGRRVTVAIGDDNSLVVDPLGRANGMKDGKLVIQTPGATVTRLAGTLQISMPNLPDGKLATFVNRAARANGSATTPAEVPVITTVQDRGRPSTLVRDTVKPQETATAVEMKKSVDGAGAGTEIRTVSDDDEKHLKAPKAMFVPLGAQKGGARVARPGLGPDPQVIARIVDGRRTTPANSRRDDDDDDDGADADRRATQVGFIPSLSFQGGPANASERSKRAAKESADRLREQLEQQRKQLENRKRR